MNIVVGVIVENTLYLSKENDDLARRRREKIESRIFDSLYDIFVEADNEGSLARPPTDCYTSYTSSTGFQICSTLILF